MLPFAVVIGVVSIASLCHADSMLDFYNCSVGLYAACEGDDPISLDKIVCIVWDEDHNGPDFYDPLVPLSQCNYNSFPIWNRWSEDCLFYADPALIINGELNGGNCIYLLIVVSGFDCWVSEVISVSEGYSTHEFTDWTCGPLTIYEPCGFMESPPYLNYGTPDTTACIRVCPDWSSIVYVGPLTSPAPQPILHVNDGDSCVYQTPDYSWDSTWTWDGSYYRTTFTQEYGSQRGRVRVSLQPDLGIPERRTQLPQVIALEIYPNPFNPTTTLQLTLERPSYVVGTIYDINGRLIRTVVDEELAGGNHRFDLTVSELPSGLYFAEFRLPTETVTKKMLLMK